jgi:group II intron reverse transcriptase/maturase
MTGTPDPETVSTRLQRIAELAREDPKRAFVSLAHHITIEWLREAHARTRKDGAAGVDGQTAADYAEDLERKLLSLLDRFKSGHYHAPPVRRTYIPKGDGRSTRPIGIPTFEDKILQRAVAMLLEAVYEQDFLDCSYGFRPGRSAHDALEALQRNLMEMGGGFVLEVDIKSYFDSLDHRQLRTILDLRVRDGVIRRGIDKWLAAGVWEAERLSRPETGTPQGGVISPLLANIYLHEVLDTWFEAEVRPQLLGRAFLVRYADDVVLVLSNEQDARRVSALLAERFGQYGLSLHPTKTRLLEFRPRRPGQGGEPGSRGFDFLGFTHYWDRTRVGGW